MNTAERHYRIVTIRERIQQLQAELCVIADAGLDEGESGLLAMAEQRLASAALHLHAFASAGPGLELSLARSIASVRVERGVKGRVVSFKNNDAG